MRPATTRPLIVLAMVSWGAAAQTPAPKPTPEPREEQIETCMACHEDGSSEVQFADGTKRPLKVDRRAFEASVHGKRLRCTDCHPATAEIPHPERRYKDLEEFQKGLKDACRSCHFGNYAKYLDSVHYRLLTSEHAPAPGCTDCHDSHAITPPGKPRTRISDTCAACHPDIQETYLNSVHGRALGGANGADVPVCTDCHRSHDIENPKEAAFLLRTPELCGSCHADKKRMEKYGLSTNVLATYLQDFHGMTASLSKDTTKGDARVTAVCVDCHGFHDIARVRDPASKVLKANLVRTCQKCHKDASDNFPTAWLSHFEPSWDRAPLVYLMKRFYAVFIPFVIGGLCLQILLHLWRVVVNR